jgi:hypothetical protein
MIICIDFDGTCVTHEYPEIGKDIGAVPVLKKLIENDHGLILYTMRSDDKMYGDVLTQAIKWFATIRVLLETIFLVHCSLLEEL